MKRSEVVEIIDDILFKAGIKPGECNMIASIILKKLEEVGLQPPDTSMDCGCCSDTGWEKE